MDLTTIDGISAHSAQVILTEIGTDLNAFPSEHHFVSWLRLCPSTPISGGKPLKNGVTAGAPPAFQQLCAWPPSSASLDNSPNTSTR